MISYCSRADKYIEPTNSFINNIIDKKLGKDDKDERISLKCQAFIRKIVHGKCWLVYLSTKVQSELPCVSGLLPEWMLLLVYRHQYVEMKEPSCCRSGNVSVLRRRNLSATSLEMSMY